MTTKDCTNCMDARELKTKSIKIAFPNSILCTDRYRSKDAVVNHNFCNKRAYVEIGEYTCFASGGFD